jgi:hypothetical protein
MRIVNIRFALDCTEKCCYKCKFLDEMDCYCNLYQQELSGWNEPENDVPRLPQCISDDIGKEIK